MSIKLYQPHDSYIRQMLSDLEVAKSLMKSQLPLDIVQRAEEFKMQKAHYQIIILLKKIANFGVDLGTSSYSGWRPFVG